MITRFSKAFLFTVFALVCPLTRDFGSQGLTSVFGQFLLGSLALLHPPSRTYVDTWTGDFFGEGGFIPPAPAQGVQGNVIMPKLGNATAK